MADFPFAGAPDDERSGILAVRDAERERQCSQLVMIPSESICHPRAAEVLAGELGNIYAEGLPQPILCHDPRETAGDEARFGSWQTRLADRRYYKGTVNANRVELLAQHAIAQVFGRLEGSPCAGDIHVNVQPLSGAAANLAVYDALLEPGNRLMGLDLSHGGHLTHGSEFNFSGRTYKVHSYGIDEGTRKLDYARIRDHARESKPRLIIGGASSYPWDFDWAELRRIADEVGALLLADVAHLAGLIAGGVLRNPLPHAHVVTFTTHKTLCGPRGAVILSTDPDIGRRIDSAVFPGMQGGPHMNAIAAIGRLFELILEDVEGFCAFQKRTVENTAFFAEALRDEGFTLEYGGTDTHMALVDLRKFPVEGPVPLDGEIASRLLEIAGIVCNKNVLPGDPDAAHARGLRFGLPWLTQRGVGREALGEIAKIIRDVLRPVRTLEIWAPQGEEKCRGRVPPGVLRPAAARVRAIAEALPYPPPFMRPPRPPVDNRVGDRAALLVRGDKVRLALDQILTARIPVDGGFVHSRMLRPDGSAMDDVAAVGLDRVGREERWLLFPHADRADEIRRWIEDLSDGYTIFDEKDLQRKMDGPSVVEPFPADELPDGLAQRLQSLGVPKVDMTKVYFIGRRELLEAEPALAPKVSRAPYEYVPPEGPVRETVLHARHVALGAKMAPFAGWDMPIQYPAGILAEHRAVRTSAGLFDVSHMSALEIAGPNAVSFLDALLANCVSRLDPGEAQYSYMLYPDGTAMDDLFVYRRERDRFMLVVNAANAERVKDWIKAVNGRRVEIDPEAPGKELEPVDFRDLREAGPDSLVGVALQGPASVRILQALSEGRGERRTLQYLVANTFTCLTLAGVPALVARTGYTGERFGFEIYVHPDAMPGFWDAVLEAGRPTGVLPAGLGARDSTRVEAGFPLFGHELEGPLDVSLTDAGYGFVVRYHVPFFIGREAYICRSAASERRVIRLKGAGRKTLRPGHVILSSDDRPVGEVASFAYAHENLTWFALAAVESGFRPEPGETVRGARVTMEKFAAPPDERSIVELVAMPRFPDDAERETWPSLYA